MKPSHNLSAEVAVTSQTTAMASSKYGIRNQSNGRFVPSRHNALALVPWAHQSLLAASESPVQGLLGLQALGCRFSCSCRHILLKAGRREEIDV